MATSSIYTISDEALIIREGRLEDCAVLAELINDSAEGAIDYLFSDSEWPIEGMGKLLEQEVYYSYANTIVAEINGAVAGMVLSFPSDGLAISEQMRNYYNKEKLQYIRYFVDNKIENCWHLDALCVRKKYRNLGIGAKLVNAVKAKAQQLNFSLVEIFVFASNKDAIRFYERHSFVLSKTIDTAGHEFLQKKKSIQLMKYAVQKA